jgi:hypothetical protein
MSRPSSRARGRIFDGIAYAFGLNYLSQDDAEQFFGSLGKVMASGGVLYLSAMLGSRERSGLQSSSSGEHVYVYYRTRQEIEQLLQSAGLEIVFSEELASPPNAPMATTDLVLIAQRVGV